MISHVPWFGATDCAGAEFYHDPVERRHYARRASKGIDDPRWGLVRAGTSLYRFSDRAAVEMMARVAPDLSSSEANMLSPWWFPQETAELIRSNAKRWFGRPALTRREYASVARKDLAICFTWNDMDVFVLGRLKSDTVVLVGEGKSIVLGDILSGEQRAPFGHLRAMKPTRAAIQYYVPGLEFEMTPRGANDVRRQYFRRIFSHTFRTWP